MKEINLTNHNTPAIVDDGDYFIVSPHLWRFSLGYARTKIDGKDILMHILILGKALDGFEWDHKNDNGLDNRRDNLRLATRTQNRANRNSYVGSSSKYKGVTWDKSRNKWIVHVTSNHKQIYLGRFTNEEDAARAYDEAAILHFGEFAKLNFPKEVMPNV